MQKTWAIFTALIFSLLPSLALAQGAEVAFGGLQLDASLPVEISADQLKISQADGSATFSGNVLIGQGEMRISAQLVLVEYSSGSGSATGQVERLLASGGVTVVNGAEAAEAETAEYTIDIGNLIMSGNVILTQGKNALAAERMVIDLNTGVATMEGRVRTIFQTGGN
jgi:lipopolysaccharide export system protein LptA